MDMENQKRVKEFAEEYGPENLVVILGAAESEAAGLTAETVTAGNPTFADPLTGVQLGLMTYHVCKPEMKEEFDEAVYDERISMLFWGENICIFLLNVHHIIGVLKKYKKNYRNIV